MYLQSLLSAKVANLRTWFIVKIEQESKAINQDKKQLFGEPTMWLIFINFQASLGEIVKWVTQFRVRVRLVQSMEESEFEYWARESEPPLSSGGFQCLPNVSLYEFIICTEIKDNKPLA